MENENSVRELDKILNNYKELVDEYRKLSQQKEQYSSMLWDAYINLTNQVITHAQIEGDIELLTKVQDNLFGTQKKIREHVVLRARKDGH